MLTFKLVDAEHVKRWKAILVGNLLSRFTDGITEDQFFALYKNAPKALVVTAINELVADGKAVLI